MISFPLGSAEVAAITLLMGFAFFAPGCGGKTRLVEEAGTGSRSESGGMASASSDGGSAMGQTGGLSGVGGEPLWGSGGKEGGVSAGGAGPSFPCELPLEVGPCRGAFPRFGFDQASGTCIPFTYGGCEGNENNFETVAECDASCRGGGSTPHNRCEVPVDCAVTPRGCCASCEANVNAFVALNSMYLDAYQQEVEQGCLGVDCAACPPEEIDTENIGVSCVENRCEAFDVRERDDLSGCEEDRDCRLRGGLGCCESCQGDDLVAISEKASSLFEVSCGQAVPCPACLPQAPEGVVARCLNGTCQVAR